MPNKQTHDFHQGHMLEPSATGILCHTACFTLKDPYKVLSDGEGGGPSCHTHIQVHVPFHFQVLTRKKSRNYYTNIDTISHTYYQVLYPISSK